MMTIFRIVRFVFSLKSICCRASYCFAKKAFMRLMTPPALRTISSSLSVPRPR